MNFVGGTRFRLSRYECTGEGIESQVGEYVGRQEMICDVHDQKNEVTSK